MGHARFVVFYLLSGFAAAVLQMWTNPESAIPMVGASGAIGGVMGAYIVLYPRVPSTCSYLSDSSSRPLRFRHFSCWDTGSSSGTILSRMCGGIAARRNDGSHFSFAGVCPWVQELRYPSESL